MLYQQRIKFYLGNVIHHKKINIYNYKNIKTIYNLNPNNDVYQGPLRKLLTITNNSNKLFKYSLGDIQSMEDIVTFVKNRYGEHTDSVILRCMNFKRHWKNVYNKPKDIPFYKKKNMIFWRGTTTGCPKRRGNRFDLVKNWFEKNKDIQVGFSFICQHRDDYKQYVKGICDISTFLKHKYILSIQGNDKDSGLNWKLNSNSLVLMCKPTVTSWLMETTLIPNYHYILLKDDFSDIKEKLEWCNNNQEKCITIIKNANNFMKQFYNKKIEKQLEMDVVNTYFNIVQTPISIQKQLLQYHLLLQRQLLLRYLQQQRQQRGRLLL